MRQSWPILSGVLARSVPRAGLPEAIVRARLDARIERTRQLADIIHSVMPRPKPGQTDSATRTFQALRIHINGELEELETALADCEKLLAPDGILAIVSFHSLEDRIVKNFLNLKSGNISAPSRHRPEIAPPAPAIYRLSPRKPILASENEITVNTRSRSAKLRVAHRIAPGDFNRKERLDASLYSYLLFCSGGQWQRPLHD